MVHEGLDVFRPRIAEVDVIGMLPDVDGEQRLEAAGDRRIGVAGLDHRQLAVVQHQPGPAGAELCGRRILEGGQELVVAAEVACQLARDGAGRLAAAARLHAVPVERVVPYLRGIVEDAGLGGIARRGLDDLFQRHACHRRVGHHPVQVVDIGLVVLAVMELEGLGRDMRRQRILGVGKRW
jgi:hypothetical protein